MSKQIRTLLIAGVAVLVLVALLLGLLFLLPSGEEEEESSSSSDTSITLLDKSTDENGDTISDPVSQAVFSQGGASYTIAPDEEGEMRVAGFDDLPVSTSAVSAMANNFATITATRKVADTSENEADFGLDEPQATAEITYADGTVVTAELGDETPLEDGYYFRLSTDEAIYIVSTSLGSRMLDKAEAYVGTSLIVAPSTREDDENGQAVVYGMDLSGTVRASKPFSVRVYEEGDPSSLSSFGYVIDSPSMAGVSQNEDVQSLFSSATSLSATDTEKAHPTSEDLAEYGLDNPYSVCELTLAVQSSSTDEDDNTVIIYYNTTEHTIRLGNKNDDGYYYALIDDYDAVFLVSASSVPWAEAQYADVVNTFLFSNNIVDVASISLTADGEETTFELEHFPDAESNDEKLTVTVDGTVYPTSDFRSLYQVFMQVERYGETDETPAGDPDVVFTVNLSDDSTPDVVARFYKQSASVYICAIEGGDTYTVKASDVENMLTQVQRYLNGEEVDN